MDLSHKHTPFAPKKGEVRTFENSPKPAYLQNELRYAQDRARLERSKLCVVSASTLPPDELTFDQGYATVSVDGFQSEGTNKHTDNNRDFKVRW